ncbi:helix-turn-helix domain-containing protein [Kitasatospora phosalacinea]|uniref:helix-turn-helix domain-containing protein n=1 Tax=Kitasatospora phosalacinea TaxID=2065 RepID=UPI00364C4FD7
MSTTRGVSDVQLGHRIAQLRERSGMKQAELARSVSWSQAVLSRVEAGGRPISDEELMELLKAIGSDEAIELADVLERGWQYLAVPVLDHPDRNLLWHAEQMTAELTDVGAGDGVAAAFRTRLDEYVHEISRLAGLLLRREHQIAFIGSIGIGKSTAICRATSLEVPGPQGLGVPVLEFGAGGVTVCEVHLSRGPGYGIVVEPRTLGEIRRDVEHFVDHLLRSRQPAAEEDGASGVPHEVERVIRNISGLVPHRTTDADGKRVRIDPLKELVEQFPVRRDLVVEVLNRMDLLRRDRKEEWHGPALAAAPLEWMKATFAQINNGRHSEFSLPARIDLFVPDLLQIGDFDVRLVDTRGIDRPTGRADLEELLEDPHTVSILCSGFNDAPSASVQHLLKRAQDINNTQIESNAAVLVLARPEEALAVKDESGVQAETSEEGYELKNEQVIAALSCYGIDENSTFFFNAREDDPEGLREFLGHCVLQARERFRRQMGDVLGRAQLLLDNAEKEQVQAVQQEAGQVIAGWIRRHPTPRRAYGHVCDTLLGEIGRVHASTVNAAARRGGEWELLSYTYQLGYGARRVAVEVLNSLVGDFVELCRTLSESKAEAREILSQAEQLMKTSYSELLRKVQLAGGTVYRDQLRADTQFWTECMMQWGEGSGYVHRVLDLNRKWFRERSRHDLESEIVTLIEREWSTVLERVEAIFEQA